MKNVVLEKHNIAWAASYEKDAALIKDVLKENYINLHHIGSSSVSGLMAKPIIDMLGVVKDISKIDNQYNDFLEIGYIVEGEKNIPLRRYLQKTTSLMQYHVHLYEEGNDEIQHYLLFRDYLKEHAEAREAYQQLKITLASYYAQNRIAYTLGKDSFIQGIIKKTHFQGFNLRYPTTEREKQAYGILTQAFAFNVPQEDANTFRFVFYKNTDIIGSAYGTCTEKNQFLLHFFAINITHQKEGHGSRFLTLLEKWALSQKIICIMLLASLSTYHFFKRSGYQKIDSDFNLGQSKKDIYMEKHL